MVVDGQYGTLTINANGSYSYTLTANPDDVPDGYVEHFTYTIADRDGDGTTASLDITLDIDQAPLVADAVARSDDDGVAGGNAASTTGDLDANVGEDAPPNPSEAIFHGQFVASGGDGALTYSMANMNGLSGTVGSETVNYSWNAGTNTLTATGPRGVLFTIAVNAATGDFTLTQVDNVLHAAGSNENDAVVHLAFGVTDSDGDSVFGDLAITLDDDMPSINTVTDPLNIVNDANPGGTGNFAFSIGADTNADNDDISVTGFTATVNGVPATNLVFNAGAENATTANYTFSFTYPTGAGGATANATGTLVFDKVAGTYTVELTNGPIKGFTLVETSDAGTVITEVNPNVSVAQLTPGLFAQFTGMSGSPATTVDYNPDPPPSDGIPGTYIPGEVLSAAATTVQVSSVDAGVAGNTLQGEEIMDINLYATNPGGVTGGDPTASAEALFITLDGIGAPEDMVVVLKLWSDTDADGVIEASDSFTTRAVMVTNADLFKFKSPADVAATNAALNGSIWQGVKNDIIATGSGNEGLIIIEANDYNVAGENFKIVGVQIAGGNNGITGSAINLNRAVGAAGDSDTNNNNILDPDNFTTDTHDGPFKIKSIGFQTESTTNQSATLEFDVTVTDDDGDSAVRNDITVNIGTPPPPVVLDMDGDGAEFIGQDAGVAYDYGNGPVATGWVGPDDGILVRDSNGNGTVDGASEFVFGGNGQTDMEALAGQYGSTLDANDADYAKFGVWQDANSNGAVDAGEYSSLAARGIVSINLVSDGMSYSAAGGDVDVAGSSTFTRVDGSTGVVADAAFWTGGRAVSDEQRSVANSNVNMTGIVASIVAAAGLQSAAAAASMPIDHGVDLNLQPGQHAINLSAYNLQAVDDGALNVQSFGVEQSEPAFDLSALQGSGHGFNDFVSNGGLDVQAYGDAVPAYEPSFALDQAPAFDASMLVAVAPTVGMPSAEALVAAGLIGNAQHGGAVEQIVAEALGNAAPTVDALLEAVNGNEQQAILEALSNVPDGGAGGDMSAILHGTSGLGVGVSSWDIGSHGAFGATADMMFKMDVASFHHDAVQPAVNG
jgi:VCBS repeat-containing protein